jgi:hypothetical protein
MQHLLTFTFLGMCAHALFGFLAFIFCAKISYCDWKNQYVNAKDLIMLTFLTFLPCLVTITPLPDISWLCYCLIAVLFLEEYRGHKIVGLADWIFLLSIVQKINKEKLSLFFMLAGFFGIVTYFIKSSFSKSTRKIPFIPSLWMASLGCLL